MQKIIAVLSIFVLLAVQTKATECTDEFFIEEKINLALCQTHRNTAITMLFKARTKVLNDYIKEKIDKGELADKKFEVHVICRLITYTHLYLTQGKNGYFVNLSGYPSLQELTAIVDYFAKPDWKPFIADFGYGQEYETVEMAERGYNADERRVNNLYESNIENEPFGYQPFPVWEKDDVSLLYSGDSLIFEINNTPLSLEMEYFSSLPVKIQDRYLFFQQDGVYVFQDKQIIKSFKYDDYISYNLDVYVYPKWVNISWGGVDHWFLSYSYNKNRFYEREKEEE